MTRTVYMINTRRDTSCPLFTFETNDELDWYVTWRLSCSTKEAYAIMEAFEKGLPFSNESCPYIQYEVRPGD